MSSKCPLCGKSKTEKSLFCPDCTEKLNSEYEVDVPASKKSDIEAEEKIEPQSEKDLEDNLESKSEEDLEDNLEPKSEESETETPQPKREEPARVIPTTSYNKRAWKRKKEDERSDSEKSYYELAQEKKTNKVAVIMVSLFVLTLAAIAFFYLYNKQVKSDNLERAEWELAQRDNTIDGYLGYMEEYPQGTYMSEAYSRMMTLKAEETEAWENLMTSENRIEFADFLEKYPESPYERKVKSRLDSLMWESSLKENSVQAYSDYINMSNLGEITGDYIGEAQKRQKILTQSTPTNEQEMGTIQATVGGFFTALSNVSTTELSEYLAPVIVRFHKTTNIPREEMIGQLLLLAAKADAKSLRIDPETENLNYERMGNDTYNVNVPIQKILEGNNGEVNQIRGYIAHLKLDADFKIFSIHETKPYSTAP